MIYLVFQKSGFNHHCILATQNKEFAKEVMEAIHDLDEPYMESIKLETIKD